MSKNCSHLFMILGLTLFIASCDNTSGPHQDTNTSRQLVKAEDHALTKNGSFMCLTQDAASTFFEHAIRAEKTKLEQILDGGECSLVRAGMKVRVLAVRDNVSEVVRIDVASPIPMWTATEFLQATKNNTD